MMSSKRSVSTPLTSNSETKRQRFSQPGDPRNQAEDLNGHPRFGEGQTHRAEEEEEEEEHSSLPTAPVTRHHFARCGMQRSIAMLLSHDGFDSATPEALESFTEIVETYLQSVIEEIKRLATASRREHPIPLDFEIMMKRYNLSLSSLRPHLKHPMPVNELAPVYVDAGAVDDSAFRSLPLLGDELSGQSDKDAKSYIPSSFPDFPSTHTYKFTPQEDTRTRDSKKIREEAARTAQQGEDALRRLVRASKMRKQKEVKSLVERDSQGKERFRMWESTMKRFMGSDGRSEPVDQVEIADHSMIVNGDILFSRQDVSRLNKRNGVLPSRTSWDRSVP